MRNLFKLLSNLDTDEVNTSKIPILAGITLVYIATVFVQYSYTITMNAAIGFTIVMVLHSLLYIFSDKVFKNKYWLYFIVQGIVIFDCAVIMPKGYETIFLGLIPVLIFQSMVVYYEAIKVIFTAIFYYSIFCGTIIIYDGVNTLIQYIPILLLITFAVRVYSTIYLKQVKIRIQSQKISKELELTYEKVEELTLANERQRMARDLHDTLSQGLAGIIMQLEAVDANLNNNNIIRAREIVKKSMEHARKTLSDSRLVIDDLRNQKNDDFEFCTAIENEMSAFRAISGITLKSDVNIKTQMPFNIYKHILYIVRESLNNIAKHSKADNAAVEILEDHGSIYININDDGKGFDVKVLDKQFGHYGILGINERVKAIYGDIKITSRKRAGTRINIIIPIKKGNINE